MITELNNQVMIYEDASGEVKLDVSLENETVWLSQKQMSILLDKTTKTINEHIKKIYIKRVNWKKIQLSGISGQFK